MNVMRRALYLLILFIILLCSCRNSEKTKIARLVNEWQNKEVVFPKNAVFTLMAEDTVPYSFSDSEYKVLVYVDSIGCTSCKLQLFKWLSFIEELDSVSNCQAPVLFFVHPKKIKDIQHTLRYDRFNHPVCIDIEDEINTLNRFPSDMTFQSFLLDKHNKVKIIGNPVYNSTVKNLYFKQITGNEQLADKQFKTTVQVEQSQVDFGKFDIKEKKIAVFVLQNTGANPLVILDVNTTCGCAVAKYNKQPVPPGKTIKIEVEMKPKGSGFFEETIIIRCNTPSLLKLTIKGQAFK